MSENIRSRLLEEQNKTKNIYTFIGILHGVVSDGSLREQEVKYLLEWIRKNKVGLNTIPQYSQLHRKLNEYLSGGISSEEETKLIAMIRLLTGNNWSNTGDVSNMPISLYDDDPSVYFDGRIFCLTGEFQFGSKKSCKEAIENLGGIFSDNVNNRTDYLIVGKDGSKDWKFGNWGTKIAKAVELKKNRESDLAIISEDDWRISLIMNE